MFRFLKKIAISAALLLCVTVSAADLVNVPLPKCVGPVMVTPLELPSKKDGGAALEFKPSNVGALMVKNRDYDAEVEYLESTGTQYIDTGYIGGSATKVEILAASKNTVSNAGLFGARKSYADGYLCSYSVWQKVSTGVRFDFSSASASNAKFATATWDTTGINTVVKDGPNNYLNGVAGANNNASTFDCEYPFYLFAINTAGSYGQAHIGKVYSCKIWDNDILVRDYIPVRVGTVGYLYDRVSKRLFGNAGTGAFQYGSDVVPVEWLEAKGNYQATAKCYFVSPYTFDGRTDAIEIECAYIDTAPYGTIFGVNQTLNGVGKRLNVRRNNRTAYFDNASQGATFPTTPLELDAWYHIQVAADNNGGCFINGTTGMLANADTYVFTEPMYIFCGKDFVASGNTSWSANAKLRYFKHRRNGSLITAFCPVRVGTEGAMMDTLTRRIYRNAGSGSFSYGSDLPYPIGGR